MDVFRRARFLGVAVAAALVLSIVAVAAVQAGRPQQADPNEEFRATLAEFYAEFDDAYEPFARIGPASMKHMLAAARRSVPSMTREELAWMRGAYPANFWRDWRMTILPALRRAKGLAPALEGPVLSSTDPSAPSASLMSHSCPDLTLEGSKAGALAFEVALYYAKGVELLAQIAHNAAGADPTGVATGVASVPLGVAMTARFVLEELQAKVDACEGEEHARILHDVLRPNVDEKVSSRASQSSVDDLKKLLTGMLDELKSLINQRANGIESLLNTRANGIESLTNDRANRIEALVNRRADYADAYQANVVAHQQLDLQVVEIERGRLLLVASEAGTTVNVSLTSMRVADVKPNASVNFHDVTTSTQTRQAGSGVLEVILDMRGPAKDATVYVISVAHGHGSISPIGQVTHTGTTIFRRAGT